MSSHNVLHNTVRTLCGRHFGLTQPTKLPEIVAFDCSGYGYRCLHVATHNVPCAIDSDDNHRVDGGLFSEQPNVAVGERCAIWMGVQRDVCMTLPKGQDVR